MPLNVCTVSFLLAFSLYLTKHKKYYLSGIFSMLSQCCALTVACPTPSPSFPVSSKLREPPALSSLWVDLPHDGGLTWLFEGQRPCIQTAPCPTHWQRGKPWQNIPMWCWWSSLCELLRQTPGLLCFLKGQANKSALNDSDRQSGCVIVHCVVLHKHRACPVRPCPAVHSHWKLPRCPQGPKYSRTWKLYRLILKQTNKTTNQPNTTHTHKNPKPKQQHQQKKEQTKAAGLKGKVLECQPSWLQQAGFLNVTKLASTLDVITHYLRAREN